MDSFAESRLDLGYDYGMTGGPEWSTSVAMTRAGYEQRNADWSEERGRWDAGERNIDKTKLEYLFAFFNARRGRAQGFRFKDWLDFQASDEALDPDGTPGPHQLVKRYTDGGYTYTKPIRKPVASTVELTRDGEDFSDYTLDDTTGEVTLLADASVDISDVTLDAPAVVTTDEDHGYSDGETVYITGTGTSLDDQAWEIANVTDDSFEAVDSDTSDDEYESGGTAEQYVQPGEDLAWGGEFDKPARFDTDRWPGSAFLAMDAERDVAIYDLPSLPIVELRL
ncbi:MAG: DUF2460 domain-containing protein [Thiohalorhabdus sp.]|uniref:DUF2460 domain-containing protein n=1 Tax=Thiohalorhabdus sp. TaxID=3094134 RepID=UPI00397F3CD5